MSLKFNTVYDFDNINNEIETNINDNNTNNINNINNEVKSKTFKQKEGISDVTKNFIRNALNKDFMNNEEQKIRI